MRTSTNTAASRKPKQPAPERSKTSPWPDAPDRQQQREAKRQAVLDTAAQLFMERGFTATSLDDIAARLHVSKPTLYYYIKSKDEILLACVRQGLKVTLEGIEVSRQAGGNALDQLRACMEVYARIVQEPLGMCLIRVGDEQIPPENRMELRRMKGEIDLAFRRLVEQGVKEGVLAPCDPKITAFVIAGALSWVGRWYQPDGHYTGAEVTQQCINTLLAGVLVRGVQAPSPSPARRPKQAVKKPEKMAVSASRRTRTSEKSAVKNAPADGVKKAPIRTTRARAAPQEKGKILEKKESI